MRLSPVLAALPALLLAGCLSSGTTTKVTSGQDSPTINEIQSEAYNGPKARIAITRFTNKAAGGWYNGQIGDGMADQLSTALVNSNRFIVLERRQINDVIREQDFGASGRVRRDTAAAVGQIEGAELLVTAAVTAFERGTGGGGGSVSGSSFGSKAGLLGSVLGSVAGGVRRSYIAIDLRIVDARTSRVVAATSVEGTATDVNLGGAAGQYFGGGALRGALSGWEKEPIGKALRTAINEAVKFISSKTPPMYYRQGPGTAAQPVAAATTKPKSDAGAEERLRKLKRLYRKKLISRQEYNKRRKAILDSL